MEPSEAYDQPVPTGESRKMMFACSFHEWGLNTVEFGDVMVHGPSSKNRPPLELHPGPPLSQRSRGALSGELRASKNLPGNHSESVANGVGMWDGLPKEKMSVFGNIQVARVLFH